MLLEADRKLADIATRQHGVFTLDDAAVAGLSARQIHRRSVGLWVSVHEGVFRMLGSVPTWRGDLLAACLGATRPVAVTERGVVTGEPERFHTGAANGWQRIVSWAGPWPVDEQWWSEDPSGRAARFQLVGADGRAWLVLCRDGQWWTEATYE